MYWDFEDMFADLTIKNIQATRAAAWAGAQTAEQVQQLRGQLANDFSKLRGVLHDISKQNRDIATLHLTGIALQQEMIRREDFQNKLEELIYQFQKLLKRVQDPQCDYPIPTRYYLLGGLLKTVEDNNISSVVIKGRDNKEAFDSCVEQASAISNNLQNDPEVKKALAWADAQERKQQALEQKRRTEEQCENDKDSLKMRIRELEKSKIEPTFDAWFATKVPAWKTVVESKRLRFWFWFIAVFLYCIPLAFMGILYIVYLRRKETIAKQLNAAINDELQEVRDRLARMSLPQSAENDKAAVKDRMLPEGMNTTDRQVDKRTLPVSIQFNCPTCNKTLKAPIDKAGATASCPGCKSTLQIPFPQTEESGLKQTAAARDWFYLKDGQRLGPISLAELQTVAASGQLQPSDMVWKQGMAQWTSATNVGELGASFVPPPLAPVIPASPPPLSTGRMDDESARVPAKSPKSKRDDDDDPRYERPIRGSRYEKNDEGAQRRPLSGTTGAVTPATENPAIVALSLLFCFPVGLYFVWKHPRWSKLVKWTCTGALAGLILLGLIASAVKQSAVRAELAEANKLWTAGQKPQAVAKYKNIVEHDWELISKDERPTVLQRVIEVEADQGNVSSARSFIEKAELNKIALALDSPKAKEVVAQIQREREEQRVADLARKKEQEDAALAKRKEQDEAALAKKKQQEDAANAKKKPKEDVIDAKKKEREAEKTAAKDKTNAYKEGYNKGLEIGKEDLEISKKNKTLLNEPDAPDKTYIHYGEGTKENEEWRRGYKAGYEKGWEKRAWELRSPLFP